jgi:hypothetical protein
MAALRGHHAAGLTPAGGNRAPDVSRLSRSRLNSGVVAGVPGVVRAFGESGRSSVHSGRSKGKGTTHSPPFSIYSAPGGLRQDPGRAAEWLAGARTYGNGSREMRVLLSTYDSRGGVEPLMGLAVRLRALGAEVRVCAPPDCAERLAEVGVPLVPVGPPWPARSAPTGRRWPRRCHSTPSAGERPPASA